MHRLLFGHLHRDGDDAPETLCTIRSGVSMTFDVDNSRPCFGASSHCPSYSDIPFLFGPVCAKIHRRFVCSSVHGYPLFTFMRDQPQLAMQLRLNFTRHFPQVHSCARTKSGKFHHMTAGCKPNVGDESVQVDLYHTSNPERYDDFNPRTCLTIAPPWLLSCSCFSIFSPYLNGTHRISYLTELV
jgi:hypothetical protein